MKWMNLRFIQNINGSLNKVILKTMRKTLLSGNIILELVTYVTDGIFNGALQCFRNAQSY
jgi:hypothetical protein